MPLQIQYSKHARVQMIERGISEHLIAEGIQRGSKSIQEPGKILAAYQYFVVVYKKLDEKFYVITVKPRW